MKSKKENEKERKNEKKEEEKKEKKNLNSIQNDAKKHVFDNFKKNNNNNKIDINESSELLINAKKNK